MKLFNYHIRPAYHEVDKMGYVYHANYVSYCHRARTELMRTFNLHDSEIELKGYMMPVISFEIQYKHPAVYDDILDISCSILELTKTRCCFTFEIHQNNHHICSAQSTIVLVDKETRKPKQFPEWLIPVFNNIKTK